MSVAGVEGREVVGVEGREVVVIGKGSNAKCEVENRRILHSPKGSVAGVEGKGVVGVEGKGVVVIRRSDAKS